MCVLRVFKNFLKVVRGGKNGVKWGKIGVKSLLQNPHLYTTAIQSEHRIRCKNCPQNAYEQHGNNYPVTI